MHNLTHHSGRTHLTATGTVYWDRELKEIEQFEKQHDGPCQNDNWVCKGLHLRELTVETDSLEMSLLKKVPRRGLELDSILNFDWFRYAVLPAAPNLNKFLTHCDVAVLPHIYGGTIVLYYHILKSNVKSLKFCLNTLDGRPKTYKVSNQHVCNCWNAPLLARRTGHVLIQCV